MKTATIIQGSSYKGSNFFDFYSSYNEQKSLSVQDLSKRFAETTGTFTMLNAEGEECLVAHCPVSSTDGWSIVSLMPMSGLAETRFDWPLIVGVTVALLALLAIDLLAMLKLNRSERQAATMAEQANKAKSEFLSNMSHEIRTPITAVLGMNELIQRESEQEAILAYSDNIQEAGKSLLGIISDILDFSKIEAGHVEFVESSYSLRRIIADLVNMTRLQAEKKGLELIVIVDPQLPRRLRGDVMRVKQVITNLLSNAVKYTKEGSVRLEFALGAIEGDEVMVHVAVADTGIGIREDEMHKLFSAFDRLDAVHTRNIEGTGLGLAISSRMLSLMGSDLKVESTYGEGSTFSFDLKQGIANKEPIGQFDPLATATKEHHKKSVARFVAPDARILAVDDTPMNLQVINGLLRRTQMSVDTAESGAECLLRFGQTDYDLVLLDYRMPEMDGIQTLEKIHELYPEKFECTPIICLTASAISGDRERMLAAGFTNYLAKPVNIDELETMLVKELPADKVILCEDEDANAAVEASEAGAQPSGERMLKQAEEVPDDWDGALLALSEMGIDVGEGLVHTGDDRELYLTVLRGFVDDAPTREQRMREDLAQKDLADYTILAHSLKSSARTIGAMELGDVAYEHELAGKAGRMDEVERNLEELMSLYGDVVSSVSKALQEETGAGDDADDAASVSATTDDVRACLSDALELLDMFEVEQAEESLGSLRDATCDSVPVRDLIAPILDDLRAYEVDAAVMKIKQLMDELA